MDPSRPVPLGRVKRFKVRKPRLPWRYAPRAPRDQWGVECGGRIKRWSYDPGAQVRAAWFAKNCGPRRLARSFDPGGPEAGTLAGARRAAGLFDENWGVEFPLTRKEQLALRQGEAVKDPFFEPPTTPVAANWIEDRIQRLRGTFGPTTFTTPASLARFCPKGGSGITCAGPNSEAIWVAEGRDLTPEEKARFTEAYCAPGVCLTGSKITPPPGVTERFIFVKPRNPAVAVKASCQPQPQPGPVVVDIPLPPPGAPPEVPAAPPGAITTGCPPDMYWALTTIGCRCMPLGSGGPPASADWLRRCGIIP